MNPPGKNDRGLRRSILFFFVSFLFSAGALGGVAFLAHSYFGHDAIADLLEKEWFGVQVRKDVVEEQMGLVMADLEFVANLDALKGYVNTRDERLLKPLANDFLSFIRFKKIYDQIRLVDKRGMEILRANYNDALPEIVPSERLQFKGERYYFKDTMALSEGEVFVSPLDLNIEGDGIELPHKPMIRFGMPLYNDSGVAVGALILNYRADKMLGALRRTGGLTTGQTMLLNSDGYWLLAPDTRDQWGFMFSDKADLTFAARFPGVWRQLQRSQSGQIVDGRGVFTFVTLQPLQKNIISSTGSESAFGQSEKVFDGNKYYWTLVSYVPEALRRSRTLPGAARLFAIGAAATAVLGGCGWLLGLLIVRRRLFHSIRNAVPLRDELTGLANERLYTALVEQTMEDAGDSGGFALLRVRVDDFESLADTYGEEVADDMIRKIGLRLKTCFSPPETLARLGRAEFVAILPQIHGRAELDDMITRVRKEMTAPFKLYESRQSVGLTITAGLCPLDKPTPRELLTVLRKS